MSPEFGLKLIGVRRIAVPAVLLLAALFLPRSASAQSVFGTVGPRQVSYIGTVTYTATASGLDPATTRYAYFRRRPGGTWIPSINSPNWTSSTSFTWNPTLSDVGVWETYVWAKDGNTPSTMNTYGYAAGHNTQPIEVFGPPTVPGPTSVSCAWTSGDNCWVTGDFTASVSASTGGLGSLKYHICRSNDATGWAGCDVHLTFNGSTSITVSGSHLPADGYRRAYYFQSQDSGGAYSGWNTPRYVRVDRYSPAVSATDASDLWYSHRTPTLFANDNGGGASANSGLQDVRYSWNTALNGSCTTGTSTYSGVKLTAPAGDNVLYACARDNTGRVSHWSGRYRVAPLGLTGTVSPASGSYLGSFNWTASASGGTPSTTRYAFFRRRPGGTWIPDINAPNWQSGNTFIWYPTSSDTGTWETYIWVKDGDTPSTMNTYGYAAGFNTGPITVQGPPTAPGPTTATCAWTASGECWVQGDFTASVTASTGGTGSVVYQICRSNDTTGFGGCDVNLTLTGGTSILVSGTHLPADGYRRAYYFQAKDSAGAVSGWNTPLYVRVDRYAPAVGATNASDTTWSSYRTATISASDAHSGLQSVRYSWNAALDAACTTGTATSPGAVLTAPPGDNLLYLCAKDNTGRVGQWSGRYRLSPLTLTGTVAPKPASYRQTVTYTASATGGTPSTTQYAFFRRKGGGAWIPDVSAPNWQAGNTFNWSPNASDVGTWETYIWVKDGDTPANMNTYGYAAGFNTGTIDIVGAPTVPGPTTVSCAWTSGEDCWVQGSFTASVTASTGGTGSLVYEICRSNDKGAGVFGGCEANITLSGGTSILVSGVDLPADGFRRSYWFQARDSAGALSGWNTPRYVRVDRYAPAVGATNASDVDWFYSRTATVSASDAHSGLQSVRYAWNAALDAACTTGTATSSGAVLTAPAGDNTLHLCAKDNTGRVGQWSGRYRIAAALTLPSCSVSPTTGSYTGVFNHTATASGGIPATTRFAFFRRRPGGAWIPPVTAPAWQAANSYPWSLPASDAGTWETYVWVKDESTPPTQNTYGYAAGCNSGPITVVGPPTVPGPTTVACAWTSGEDCWVTGDFTASVTASTGGMGSLVYEICRSNDKGAGVFGGCEVNLTLSGGTSILVSGTHLPSDGFRRSYWFQAKDSAGGLSGWNTPRYVRVDRQAPAVSASNASDTVSYSSRTATVAASDAGSGVQAVRYSWNTALDAGCTTGTATSSGAALTAPPGDNLLHLCAKDNTGRVGQWSGRYKVSPLTLTGTVSPKPASYRQTVTYTATATGGTPSTIQYAFFRRKGTGAWTPDVTTPNWQPGPTFTWSPNESEVGTWETYIWVRDGDTPATMNTHGYAAGFNTGTIDIVGKPTVPGATTVSCAHTAGEDCWVQGDFTASVTASTGGLGSLTYQICRSNDKGAGVFGGCEVNLTLAGGTSILVSGTHLPAEGFRRSYWFQAQDSAGALSGWNTPRYVRVDRNAPTVSASNASDAWVSSQTATVSAADTGSGVQSVRYGWGTALDANCTTGTVTSSGAALTAPTGDNLLYLCAKDNVGRVAQWNGRYKVAAPLSVTITPSPAKSSYLTAVKWIATASGGVPGTVEYNFGRHRFGSSDPWIPSGWQSANEFTWQPTVDDVGIWEAYVVVRDSLTPPDANGAGYAAGANPGKVEIVGPPTRPGPTTVSCASTSGEDCWVAGDFTATVAPSTGGMGSLVYQICRSNDKGAGVFGGCEANLTLSGGTSILVSGTHLPADGFRRSYWFQAKDSAGALSGWNEPRYVRVDRNAPTVSASNASDLWFGIERTATVSAADDSGGAGFNSGLKEARYAWNAALDAGCTAGTATSPGATLAAPVGDNVLYLCAKDNVGRVAQWNGRYRLTEVLTLTGTISPRRGSYLGKFTYTATATGGTPSSTVYAFFRRKPGQEWIPPVNAPNWQAGNTFDWNPTLADVGTWETYIWVKDGNTPPDANGFGYAAGFNTQPIEVVGPPAKPGATTVSCVWTTAEDCWVAGDFTASVAAATDGMEPLVYQICRSNDSAGGFAVCDVNLTLTGGTSIVVSGDHLPGDGFRRAYWFQAKDSAGALSGWNTPRHVRIDRHDPLVGATNASYTWVESATATVSASDDDGGTGANSGLVQVRYAWNAPLDAACTAGAVITPGTTLDAPDGDNVLHLCALDNAGRVGRWSGRYRVGEAPDFSVRLAPASASIGRGGQATFTVSIEAAPGFADSVALSVSGLPAAASRTLEPAAVGAGQTATLTVSTTSSTPEGTFELTVTATGGSLTRSAAAQLRVGKPQKPVLSRIFPDSFPHGGRVRVTVEGSFLSGSTVSIAKEQTDPDDPVSRAFPSARVLSVNSTGTSMEVEVDATDTRVLDFHNLVVNNGTDIEAAQFRVLPGGPIVDAWSPARPEVGRLHALSIAGRNLAGTTITPSVGGRIRLHSVETSDTEITALLEVLPDAPTGSMKLIVADGVGRRVEVPITIALPQENASVVSRNLTASRDGKELDGSYRRPAIWFQEFTVRDPDNTEVLAEGTSLRIQGIDRETLMKRLAEPMRNRSGRYISWEVYIKVTIPLVKVQWQKVILFNPLTGVVGDDVLQGLGLGDQVPISAFVLSAYLQIDLTVYFRMASNTAFTFPRFCIVVSYGIEITGFDGFAYHDSWCTPESWFGRGRGTVTDGEITGGDCASVTSTGIDENGFVDGIVEQDRCCSQPIGVAMSGHTFTGLSWGKNFSASSSEAGTTTVEADCDDSEEPPPVPQLGVFLDVNGDNVKQDAEYLYTKAELDDSERYLPCSLLSAAAGVPPGNGVSQLPQRMTVFAAYVLTVDGKLRIVPPPAGVTSVQLELQGTSQHVGIATNWPITQGGGTGSSASDPDFWLATSSSAQPSQTVTASFGTPAAPSSVAAANLFCNDYGGSTTLIARPSGGSGAASAPVAVPALVAANRLLPAIGWTDHAGVQIQTGSMGDRDDDDTSAGNQNNGDGFSAFSEYRGIRMNGVHYRLNPAEKDAFVEWSSTFSNMGGTSQLGLRFHRPRNGDYFVDSSGGWWMNIHPAFSGIDPSIVTAVQLINDSTPAPTPQPGQTVTYAYGVTTGNVASASAVTRMYMVRITNDAGGNLPYAGLFDWVWSHEIGHAVDICHREEDAQGNSVDPCTDPTTTNIDPPAQIPGGVFFMHSGDVFRRIRATQGAGPATSYHSNSIQQIKLK